MSGAKSRCGKCRRFFEPKPIFYGGGELCDDCREKYSDKIDEIISAYHNLSIDDQRNIDLASAISGRLPKSTQHCTKCGCETDGTSMCHNCYKRMMQQHDQDVKRYNEKANEAKKEFDKKLRRL